MGTPNPMAPTRGRDVCKYITYIDVRVLRIGRSPVVKSESAARFRRDYIIHDGWAHACPPSGMDGLSGARAFHHRGSESQNTTSIPYDGGSSRRAACVSLCNDVCTCASTYLIISVGPHA